MLVSHDITGKGAITSKVKHAIKHTIKIIAATTSSCNKSPARLALDGTPSLAAS